MSKVYTTISFLFLFFGLQAQNVNPFELYDAQKKVVVNVDSSQLGSNSSAIIISDSVVIDKTSLVPDASASTEAVSSPAQLEIVPEKIESSPGISNPFELIINENQELVKGVAESEKNDVGATVDTSVITSVDSSLVITEMKPKTKVPLPSNHNVVFWISLVSGLLLSILFTNKRNIITEISKSLRNMNYMKLFQKDEKNGFSVPFFLLTIIYVLNISVFIRFVAMKFEIAFLNYNLWFIIIVVGLLLILRHFSLIGISYLRKRLPDAISYSFIILMINSVLGLIMIPINLLIAFGPTGVASKAVFIGLFVIGFFWILKWLRGILNSLRIILGDSFHFLLYLCGCEIVPILICIGFVRSLIN